jgi:hypothetical protein
MKAPEFVLHICIVGLPRSGRFMVGEATKEEVSIKIMASLPPARAEGDAGVVVPADQNIDRNLT